MKSRSIIFSIVILTTLSIGIPFAPALADCNVGNFLPPCTCSGQCKLTDFLALGANIMKYAVGILAAVAIGFLINSGFSLITAMGNPEKIDAGKKQLGGTFKGLAMVMMTWLLVSTIIFFATGNSSGLLFSGRGNPWWEFKETQLHEMYLPYEVGENCPARISVPQGESECSFFINLQTCTDTSGLDAQVKATRNCLSLGVCPGGPEMICCDILADPTANPTVGPTCPDADLIKKYITGAPNN
ncbi:MAG: pilin [Patescibacteria group bacterium]